MIAVITGDIINSKRLSPPKWMEELKRALSTWGKTPEDWELYRGDGFQLKIQDPEIALKAAVQLKASIKSIEPLDVRMSIGIGEEDYVAERILESNGLAYVRSGEGFESLDKLKQTMLIETPWEELNQELNLMLKLALTIMDNWTAHSSKMIELVLANPEQTQKALGDMEGISQHAVSARLSRANFSVIEELLAYCSFRLKTYLK